MDPWEFTECTNYPPPPTPPPPQIKEKGGFPMGNGQDHFSTTGKIASVPTATHNNNSWRAWVVQS